MINGQIVTLRPIEKDDLKTLLEIKSSVFVRNNVCGTFLGQNQDQMIQWYESISSNKKDLRFSVIDNKSNKVIGMVGLYNIDHLNRNAEFGIYLSEQDSGQGRGTEATQLLTEFGFNTLNLKKVYLLVLANNDRAINVYKKIGYQIEGTLKNHTFKNGKHIDTVFMAKFSNE